MGNNKNKRKKISDRKFKNVRVRNLCKDGTNKKTVIQPVETVPTPKPGTSTEFVLEELHLIEPSFYNTSKNLQSLEEAEAKTLPRQLMSPRPSAFRSVENLLHSHKTDQGINIQQNIETTLSSVSHTLENLVYMHEVEEQTLTAQDLLTAEGETHTENVDTLLPGLSRTPENLSMSAEGGHVTKALTREIATPQPPSPEISEELPYLLECETTSTLEISGRRIVDITYFLTQLQEFKHESLFKCGFSELRLIKETRRGLISHLIFQCEICNASFKVCTDNPANENNIDINSAAVTGIIASGIGYSQFEESMSAMDIPIFREKFYSKVQDFVHGEWEAAAVEAMERAAAREREAAIEDGRIFNGVPIIDVFADGAWSKRSYGNNYNAMSGVAAIVGRKFGEVLFIGVKNKYCLICARAEKNKQEPKEHTCYKNYEGAASGMEASIICEGFKESINMYGIMYGTIVADGDSATYAKILASNPYPGYVVSKIECRNHLLRNLCNKLRALAKDTKYPQGQRKNITDEKVMSIRKVITSSIKHNKEIPRNIGIKQVQEDIGNALNHAYGDHRSCKVYYCSKEKAIMSSTVAELEKSSFWFRLKVILNAILSKSRSLLEDVDTNAVERFNSIVAKFIGGKRINFTQRRSYQSRCSAAVVSYNTKRPLYMLHKKILGKSPRGNLKKLEERKQQRRTFANAVKRKKNRTKNLKKQFDYGLKVAAPDMPEDVYRNASADFMSNLTTLVDDRKALQERTTQQRESNEWLQIRRLLITASNFGVIIKRKKKFGALVNNILYKKNISSVASVAHGIKNEKFALQQLASQENICVRECGLFVDQEFPYMGATPDGVVAEDTIVEVKCPVAAFKIGIKSAVEQNKIQILNYNRKTDQISINKSSNWYYQVQGQLRVTGRQRCIFGIWGGENEKMEVLYIQKDDNFWINEMQPKLIKFYNDHLLPELVDSRRDRGMPMRDSEK